MKRSLLILGCLFLLGTATPVLAQDQDHSTTYHVKKGVEKGAQGVKKGAVKTGQGIKKGAKEGAQGVKKGVNKGVEGVKKAGNKVGEEVNEHVK